MPMKISIQKTKSMRKWKGTVYECKLVYKWEKNAKMKKYSIRM